ncbi:MAG: hypothetical protein U9R74_12775 [Pseudomonadota bacterium]|nr:hypothetical protein [Pseudomonadota bacterium]
MFSFDNVSQSQDGGTLSCSCVVAADMPFFSGHFPGMPIMPAVAQIEMIRTLLEQQAGWNATISGGTRLKFSGLVQPGDILAIRLRRTPSDNISFSVENDAAVVSKGVLTLEGGALD